MQFALLPHQFATRYSRVNPTLIHEELTNIVHVRLAPRLSGMVEVATASFVAILLNLHSSILEFKVTICTPCGRAEASLNRQLNV